MTKIDSYIESGIMDISIQYGNEKFSFNLGEEVKIEEVKIEKELQTHSARYSFLLMLYKRLAGKAKDAERVYKKVRSETFQRLYKNTGNASHSREAVDADTKCQMAWKRFLRIEQESMLLQACVKSFEARKDLIQTLSANIRNDRKNV